MPNPPVLEATDRTLADVTAAGDRVVLVDFWAPWCGPCRALSPVLEGVAGDMADTVSVVAVDVDQNPESVREHAVTSVPTLLLFRNGAVVKRLTGARSRADLVAEIESVASGPV